MSRLFTFVVHFIIFAQPIIADNSICYSGWVVQDVSGPTNLTKLTETQNCTRCTTTGHKDHNKLSYQFRCVGESATLREPCQPCYKYHDQVVNCCCQHSNLCNAEAGLLAHVQHLLILECYRGQGRPPVDISRLRKLPCGDQCTLEADTTRDRVLKFKFDCQSQKKCNERCIRTEKNKIKCCCEKQSLCHADDDIMNEIVSLLNRTMAVEHWADAEPDSISRDKTGMVVALSLVGGLIVLIALITIGVCCYRWRKKRRKIRARQKARQSGKVPESNDDDSDSELAAQPNADAKHYDNVSGRSEQLDNNKRARKKQDKAGSETASLGSSDGLQTGVPADSDRRQRIITTVGSEKPGGLVTQGPIVTEHTNPNMYTKNTNQ